MAAPAASSVTDAISYDDLYARWERGNWRATEIDFTPGRVDWHERLTEEQRRSALWLYTLFFHGEDSVTDNLSPFIDAAPLEEQKYFLDHPAGRRGAPLGLLQALHARGGRRRRRDAGRRPARHGRRDHVGPPPGLQPPGPDGRRAAPRPLEDQARRGGDALPPRRRGLAGPARAAHDRGLARGARRAARLPRGHAQRLARRAAPHRLRRQAAGRPLPRGPRADPGRDRRAHQGGPAVDVGGGQAAELGPLLHGVLRLHAGGHGRVGRGLDRAAPARHRAADRHHPRLPDADGPAAARARRPRAEAAARRAHRPRRRRRRPGPRGDRDHVRHDPPRGDHRRRAAGHHDRVGLRRRRAVARRPGQRRARARCRAARRTRT